MSSSKKKLIFGSIVLLSAVGYLAIAGVKKGWVYFMPVDQYMADEKFHTQRVRLNGKVADNDLQINRAGLVCGFDMLGDKQHLRVEYKGVIPDMFRAGHEVVVEGRQGPDGVFHADVLMTKCASKYDADKAKTMPGHPAVNAQLTAEQRP